MSNPMVAPSVTLFNYAGLIQAVHDIATNNAGIAGITGTKIGLLPFPLEVDAAGGFPFLAVRWGKFRGFTNGLQVTGAADLYARMPGGVGRIMVWDFDVVVLYGYREDATSVTTAARAAGDLMLLEACFQTYENLNGVCDWVNVANLDQGPLTRLSQAFAGQQLWFNLVTVRTFTTVPATY